MKPHLAIDESTNGTLVKIHHVAGERPCLVGEDVFDLAQLVTKVPCARNTSHAELGIEHLLVLADKVRLQRKKKVLYIFNRRHRYLNKLDDFHARVEGNRDEVLRDDHQGPVRLQE